MYVYVYIYIYVHMSVCVYIYIHTYTHIHTEFSVSFRFKAALVFFLLFNHVLCVSVSFHVLFNFSLFSLSYFLYKYDYGDLQRDWRYGHYS